MSSIARLMLLALLGTLVACGSAPAEKTPDGLTANFDPTTDPYWEDARWAAALLNTVQAAVHDPVDASDRSTPDLHATVKVTYLQGMLEYPEIVASTGDPEMDKLMLHQIASMQAPQATGLQTDRPHELELDLDMPTPYEAFQSGIYAAFDANKIYSREAVIGGYQGMTTLGFDYLDGKLSNLAVTKSSQSKELDKRSLETVERAKLPPTPDAYAGKTLHMEASFCYALGSEKDVAQRCPTARNVILVTGMRIRRAEIYTVRSKGS